MSSIQDGWSFQITVSPQHWIFSECATHWQFNSGSLSFSMDVIDSPEESVLTYLEFVCVTACPHIT